MFPGHFATLVGDVSFPRMRGDVPKTVNQAPPSVSFSPHARGCSHLLHTPAGEPKVFPACAGMFRISELAWRLEFGFPRMRGDVPEKCPVEKMKTQFSPHARGCSASLLSASLNRRVFPACAGMFPCFRVPVNDEKRFPRMRGDVPPI